MEREQPAPEGTWHLHHPFGRQLLLQLQVRVQQQGSLHHIETFVQVLRIEYPVNPEMLALSACALANGILICRCSLSSFQRSQTAKNLTLGSGSTQHGSGCNHGQHPATHKDAIFPMCCVRNAMSSVSTFQPCRTQCGVLKQVSYSYGSRMSADS